jgi:hypothetical protein
LRRPDYEKSEVSENTFKEILERSERNAGVSHAKSMFGITDKSTTPGTVMVGVLTRSKTRVLLPRGKKWSTLQEPTAEGMLESSTAQAAGTGDACARSQEREAPYGKIPDALTTFLLSLQAEDAWCRKQEWKAFPDNEVKDGPYRDR